LPRKFREKLRKVNMLSAELQKHNMATSSDDAFMQAEQMVKQEEVREFIQRAKSSEKNLENPTADHLYQVQLERTNRQLSEHIQNMQNQLDSLKAEIQELKKAPRAPIQAPQQNQVKVEAPKAEQQAVLQTQKEEPHPKQGEFKSDDVAVDKIFYFGNK